MTKATKGTKMINVNEQVENFVDRLVAQGVPLVDILVEFETKTMSLREQVSAQEDDSDEE